MQWQSVWLWPKQVATDLHGVLTMPHQPSRDQHTSRNKGTASFCRRQKGTPSFCSKAEGNSQLVQQAPAECTSCKEEDTVQLGCEGSALYDSSSRSCATVLWEGVEYLQRHLGEESRGLHPLREGDRLWGRRAEQKDSAGIGGGLQA